ncbi:hypothetical protein CEXT_458231 [Caerostris extrusa]|uniref:Uncharacterized protein n=1 Tax=Caerostris extrusa TaxID=172846 RepID=A0AAV4YA55_CAEEX|nr:hypothetical protein CEXT_458231 [Caerostris extrusa]
MYLKALNENLKQKLIWIFPAAPTLCPDSSTGNLCTTLPTALVTPPAARNGNAHHPQQSCGALDGHEGALVAPSGAQRRRSSGGENMSHLTREEREAEEEGHPEISFGPCHEGENQGGGLQRGFCRIEEVTTNLTSR